MGLADKMFSRSGKMCPVRSDCKKQSDKKFFDSLFENDWEVFVIKRDNQNGKFDWFTQCCEAAPCSTPT
jgi:hypothetical protein